MSAAIYLDYNATTPVDERVLERMLPYFTQHFGNASSGGHMFGWAASAAVEQARQEVADCLGVERPGEISFTSGSTEGINAAIKGISEAYAHKGRHIVTVQTEHSATRKSCQHLQRQGYRVTYLSVCSQGLVDLEELERSLSDDTILVSIMWANNETGVVQPIEEISRLVRSRGILFMTDATQAVGKVPVSVDGVDVLVCSGHKIFGPKGVGALYMRERVRRRPLIDGGGQERGHRGGTLNVPGIVGLGESLRLARLECDQDHKRLESLRDSLEDALDCAIPGLKINGKMAVRLPQTSNVTFPRVDAERLQLGIRTLAVSTGSACASQNSVPSPVLTAMGLNAEEARRTLRISLGRPTTGQEVEAAKLAIIGAMRELGVAA